MKHLKCKSLTILVILSWDLKMRWTFLLPCKTTNPTGLLTLTFHLLSSNNYNAQILWDISCKCIIPGIRFISLKWHMELLNVSCKHHYKYCKYSEVLFHWPIDSWSVLPKMHFLNILEIFRLDVDQITKHDSMPFFPLASHFSTFLLRYVQKSKFSDKKVTYPTIILFLHMISDLDKLINTNPSNNVWVDVITSV